VQTYTHVSRPEVGSQLKDPHRAGLKPLGSVILMSLLWAVVPGCSRRARGTPEVHLTVDTVHPHGRIDLTRYSLGQGGFSYRPMIDKVIPQVRQLHPQTIRLFVQEYFNLYPAHGVYEWGALDKAIEAILATGAKPIMNLCFKPKILFPKIDERLVYPTSWAEWDQLVYRLVKHCNDERRYGIEYWEVANEPNLPDGGGTPYGFTPEEYLTFYTHTVNAVRRADSSAKVGGPTLATWEKGPLLGEASPILDALIDYCGKGMAPLDFVSWHLYDNHPQLFRKETMEVRALLTRYPRLQHVETILDEWNMSLGSPIMTPGYQAAFIMEVTDEFYQAGLSRSGYYQIKDEFLSPKMFSAFMPENVIAAEEHFFNVLPIYLGLYDVQGRVRPSYYALKLLSLIKGDKLAVTGMNPEIKAFAARNGTSIHVVFWNFPGKYVGNTLDVTLRFQNESSGRYEVIRLNPESGVNSLELVRTGNVEELKQRSLKLNVRPYDICWVELSQ
jgi:xylan 1,4-beta-xylosidase